MSSTVIKQIGGALERPDQASECRARHHRLLMPSTVIKEIVGALERPESGIRGLQERRAAASRAASSRAGRAPAPRALCDIPYLSARYCLVSYADSETMTNQTGA